MCIHWLRQFKTTSDFNCVLNCEVLCNCLRLPTSTQVQIQNGRPKNKNKKLVMNPINRIGVFNEIRTKNLIGKYSTKIGVYVVRTHELHTIT